MKERSVVDKMIRHLHLGAAPFHGLGCPAGTRATVVRHRTVREGKSSRTNRRAVWNPRRLVSRSAEMPAMNQIAHSPALLRLCFCFTSKSQTSYKICSCRPVALTVRAPDSKSGGWGFESLLACQGYQGVTGYSLFPFLLGVHIVCTSSG